MVELDDLTMEEAIEWLEDALDKSKAENPHLSQDDQNWEKLRLAVDVDEAFKYATRLGKVDFALVQCKRTTEALALVKKFPEQSKVLAKAVLAAQGLHVQVQRFKKDCPSRRVTKNQAQSLEARVATLSAQVKELTKAVETLNAQLDAK